MFRKRFDVVTIGGATRDIMFFTDAGVIVSNPGDILRQKLVGYEYGAKIKPNDIHFVLGGGGCNTAINFARLGLKTATFLRLGLDRDGDTIQAELSNGRVNTQFIERDSSEGTGFSFIAIHEPSREHTAFLYRGANNQMKMTQAELRRARAKWFYVSSLAGKNWAVTLKNLVKYLGTEKKTKLAWNPGSTQIKKGKRALAPLLKYTDTFIVNKDEAIELVLSESKAKGQTSIWKLAKTLQGWGPRRVVITHGSRGAYVFDGENKYYEKAITRVEKDTTGAGDAFGSTFIAGLILFRGNVKRALRSAIVNSSSVVGQVGAQNGLLSRSSLLDSVKKKYKDW